VASAATFAVGAGVPLVAALLAPESAFVLLVGGVSLACLVGLGALAAAAGGASPWIGAARVGFWGSSR
jgi:VIT1/CCC1 family predicted Fe2+/Mn2+ transporter